MSGERGAVAWSLRHRLALALAVQAALLSFHLDLLPIWGDEQFTLHILALPWDEIPAALAADIHPPLYFYLASLWSLLPWPAEPVVAARAFSVACALAGTVALARLWLPLLPRQSQSLVLALWVLHPALLLYSRMARSYSLQTLAALLFAAAAIRFAEEPRRRRSFLGFTLSGALLLWTHYLPGVALVGAAGVVLLVKFLRRAGRAGKDACLTLAAAAAVIALLYAPWLAVLASALERVQQAQAHPVAASPVADLAVRLAYWFVSFHFGEALPWWLFCAAAAVSPVIAGTALTALRGRWRTALPAPTGAILIVAALLGFLGTWRWVSAAFTPARLLFLLPFWLCLLVAWSRRGGRVGSFTIAALLAIAIAGDIHYFQQTGFLNKGYLIPFGEIAAKIREQARPDDLVLVDGYNADPKPLLAKLSGSPLRSIVIADEASHAEAAAEIRAPGRVWYARSTRDLSPGRLQERLDQQLAARRRAEVWRYLPYDPLDRLAAKALARERIPSHHYQLTRYSQTTVARASLPIAKTLP